MPKAVMEVDSDAAREAAGGSPPNSAVRREDALAALDRVLGSVAFQASDRLSRFLRHLVEQTLEGHGDRLKEYSLGVDVLGRTDSFDPRTDSIVRVEASRLRAKLAAYYRADGVSDAVHIELPRGTYVPKFRIRVNTGAVQPCVNSCDWRKWVAVLAVPIVAAVWWLLSSAVSRAGGPAPAPPAASLAVLPFVNLNHDRETEYVSDGITSEVMRALSRVPGLRVVARSSSFQFKGRSVDVRRIGSDLNVSAIVEGSVRRERDRWVITVELANTEDGFQLWSRTYNPHDEELAAMQVEVAKDVARALKLPLINEGSGLGWKRRTSDAEAYNLVLRARYLDPTSTDTVAARIGYYKQAIARDPRFADAWVGVADTWMRLAATGGAAPHLLIKDARYAVAKARELDDGLPDTHFLTAMLKFTYDWDWKEADREFRRAIELDPSSARHRSFYALYLSNMGRTADAVREIDTIRVLEPVPATGMIEASVYYMSRDFDRTIRFCRTMLQKEPAMPGLRYWLGRALASKGMQKEALAELEIWHTARPDTQGRGFGMLARTYAEAGRRQDALRVLDKALTRVGESWVSPVSVAGAYIGLGEYETALDWLDKGYQERDSSMTNLNVEPAYDVLRRHPRFVALLRRMKLQ